MNDDIEHLRDDENKDVPDADPEVDERADLLAEPAQRVQDEIPNARQPGDDAAPQRDDGVAQKVPDELEEIKQLHTDAGEVGAVAEPAERRGERANC